MLFSSHSRAMSCVSASICRGDGGVLSKLPTRQMPMPWSLKKPDGRDTPS